MSESHLRALRVLCSERDEVLEGIVEYYGVVDSPAGKTARDRWPRTCPSGCYTAAATGRGWRRMGCRKGGRRSR